MDKSLVSKKQSQYLGPTREVKLRSGLILFYYFKVNNSNFIGFRELLNFRGN